MRIGLGALAIAVLSAMPLPVLAEGGHGGGGSLPQMDATTFPGQLFWLAVCFPLLFLLMRFLAMPRVQRTQDKRRQTLRTDLDAAESANNDARQLREAYEQALAEARSKAQSSLNEMAAEASREEAERREAQQKELAKRVAEAEARISSFREKAMGEAREAAADLANEVVAKLLGLKKAG